MSDIAELTATPPQTLSSWGGASLPPPQEPNPILSAFSLGISAVRALVRPSELQFVAIYTQMVFSRTVKVAIRPSSVEYAEAWNE